MLIKWRCDVSTVYSIWGGGAAIWRFHVKSTVGRMAEGKSRNYIIWKYKRAHNNSEQKNSQSHHHPKLRNIKPETQRDKWEVEIVWNSLTRFLTHLTHFFWCVTWLVTIIGLTFSFNCNPLYCILQLHIVDAQDNKDFFV